MLSVHGGPQLASHLGRTLKLHEERTAGDGIATGSLTQWANVSEVQLTQRQVGEVLWEGVVAEGSATQTRLAFERVKHRWLVQ